MLKATAQKGTGQKGSATRTRMIQAALATLKEEGFAGASARVIAARGGFNQALVFYHFGSVKDLLLAALDTTSADRMARYEEVLAQSDAPQDLLRAARELHAEDLASGHVTVLAEMIAGSINDPDLSAAITERVEPWIDFTERAIDRLLAGTPLAALLPTRELAFGLVSFYVGADLLTAMDGDRSRTERLFEVADRLVPSLLASLPGSDAS